MWQNFDEQQAKRESELLQVVTQPPVLDYAGPVTKPRHWLRRILVVLDPWVAITASIQLLLDDYWMTTSRKVVHHQTLIGSEQWSLFAWCWRYTANDALFYLHVAGSVILITVVCAPSQFRRWIYGVYLATFIAAFGLDWAASAYLKTQLQGVWSCCMPQTYLRFDAAALTLIAWNLTATILLIRLVAPKLEFAG